MKRNLRKPVISLYLLSAGLVIFGVMINADLVMDFGAFCGGIVTLWVSVALGLFGHTELLAGASEPIPVGRWGWVLIRCVCVVLFLASLSLIMATFLK